MVKYRIYSSERPGRSFNFEFSKGGAYSRETLFRGRRSLNISKRHQNTFNTTIYKRKIALQAKLAVLWNFFFCTSQMSAPLNTIFQKSASLERKEWRSFQGDAH